MRCIHWLAVAILLVCTSASAAVPPPLAWNWHEFDQFEVRTVKHTRTRTVTKVQTGDSDAEEETISASTLLRIDVLDVLENGRVRLLLSFLEFEVQQENGPASMKLSAKLRPDGTVEAAAQARSGGGEILARETESLLRELGANLLALRIHAELSGSGEVLSTHGEGQVVPRGEGSLLQRVLAASMERLVSADDLAQAAVGEAFPQLSPKPPSPGARWPAKRVFTMTGLTFAGKGAAFVTSSDPGGAVVTLREEMIYSVDPKVYTTLLEALVEQAAPGAKVKSTLRPEGQAIVKYSGRFDAAHGHSLDWSVPDLDLKIVATTTITRGDMKATVSQRIGITGDLRSTWRRVASPLGAPEEASAASFRAMPQHFVRTVEKIGSLSPGESAWVRSRDIRCAPDGSAWFLGSAPMWRTLPPSAAAGMPRLTRAGEKDFDVDLTACTATWALVESDGTSFKPTREHTRVRSFAAAGGPPSGVLPDVFRGKRLWELRPGEIGWLGAGHILIDRGGGGWVYANWPVRAQRFVDSYGPAVAITATERDVVKFDVTGTTHRWIQADMPQLEDLAGADGLQGHMKSPFPASSFTRDGRTTASAPAECIAPRVRDVAVGAGAFLSGWDVRMDAQHRLWLDGTAQTMRREDVDDWEFPAVSLRRLDAKTFALDLAGSAYRWTVANQSREPLPTNLENGGSAAETKWLRVAEIVDAEKRVSATLPEPLRAEPAWSLEPGAVAWASCHYVGADAKGTGWVAGFAPVRREPFADDLGPAVSLTMGSDRTSCSVELSGVTHRWAMTAPVEYAPTSESTPGSPRVGFLRVTKFTITPTASSRSEK